MKAFCRIYEKVNFVKLMTDCLITIAILVMAVALNGDWIIIYVHLMKQFGIPRVHLEHNVMDEVLTNFELKDFRNFWINTMLSAYGIYFTVGGFLHWYYYVRQKDNAESWKCQPTRWLSRELELDEIRAGCLSLLVTNTWSSFIACYSYNEGKYSTIYYQWDEYGVLWWLLQFPLIFFYQDYTTYWLHRIFHEPYLYKRFHYVHHKYQQPTAFSVTAVHPVEISLVQFIMSIPLFTIPIHWFPTYVVFVYMYYHGILTHCGINLKAKWWQPWQLDTIFHDNHHQYYHVNFGINCDYWDKDSFSILVPNYVATVYSYFFGMIIHSGITFKAKWWQPWQADAVYHDNHHQYHNTNYGINSFWWDVIHNTYRKPDRIYNENLYHGKGKPIEDISPKEYEKEILERQAESKMAYEEHKNPFLLYLIKLANQR